MIPIVPKLPAAGSELATFVRGEEVGANKEGNPDMEEDDYDGGRTDAFDLESEYFVQQSAFSWTPWQKI